MNWEYRVVARVHTVEKMRTHSFARPHVLYSIEEVYHDEESGFYGMSDGKAHLQNFESLQDMTRSLEDIPRALTLPVLWVEHKDLDMGTFTLVEEKDYTGVLSRYDRLLGSVLGCALGDAIGAPMEMMDSDEIRTYIEDHVIPGNYEGVMRDYGSHPFGQVTDDTQCTRLIMQSFDDNGLFQPQTFGQNLVDFVNGPGLVGYGSNTIKAINRLEDGIPWYESGMPAPAAGNGGAMRAGILGVSCEKHWGSSHRVDWTPFIELVKNSCMPTHASEEAIFGAQIVAGLSYLLSKQTGPHLPSSNVLTILLIHLKPFYGHLDMFKDYVRLVEILSNDEDTFTQVYRKAKELQPYDEWWPGMSPYVRSSVFWAVASFLMYPTDFKVMISTAITIGGDVDTMGAIAGSLFGSYNGSYLYDRNLLALIQDRGEWKLDDYMDLAWDLHQKISR